MARLTAKQRSSIKSSNFAVSSKAKTSKAKKASGNYPIPDKGHAEAALGLVSRFGSPAKKAEVRAAVKRKFPNLGKSSSTTKSKSTRSRKPTR